MLTPEGQIIMAAERNTIINGIDAVLRGAQIPEIQDLIAPVLPTDIVRPDFDTLAQNGEFFYAHNAQRFAHRISQGALKNPQTRVF